MCGIAGILNLSDLPPAEPGTLKRMIGALQHRGPDESGIYVDDFIGLAQSRLSIIDLAGGAQPMHNEDKTLWIVFNGEIFNYKELVPELTALGHQFYTHSDTETILHAYEQFGADCVLHFNGQFAFAIWNSRRRELFVARDRVGIRPLHYTIHRNRFIFASEIKAILTLPDIPRRLDPIALEQIFTFWTTLPGKTAFDGIFELPPGCTMTLKNGRLATKQFWQMPFCRHSENNARPLPELVEQAGGLLHDAIRLRLRADVPVGCYLSGGLDSSGITARVVRDFDSQVNTFGIRFEDVNFDEGDHQQMMVRRLGVNHTELLATNRLIGQAFKEMLIAAEKPQLRTGPVPLFLLSKTVRNAGLKVVLTGEGADEFFGGYDIFRETKIRRSLSRFPNSQRRASLIGNLHPYIFKDPKAQKAMVSFFTKGLESAGNPLFSHLLRWDNTRRTKLFFSDQLNTQIGNYDPYSDLLGQLPPEFYEWDYLSKSQYLESALFLSNYLLSSQGDRVAMANSVEIRLPFLDYRLIEFMATVPACWKVLGIKEKYLLKKVFADILPQEILSRPKHPYRAPIVPTLLKTGVEEHTEILSETAIRKTGLFDPAKVTRLVTKLNASDTASEVDSMALVGILSTQLLSRYYIENPIAYNDIGDKITVFIDHRTAKT